MLVLGLALARGAQAQPPTVQPPPPVAPDAPATPAIEELQRRYLQTNDPEVGLALARALVRANRWLEADAFYREVSGIELAPDSPPTVGAAKAVAASERDELRKRMPGLVITIEAEDPSAVHVFVNDVRVPANEIGARRLVDPGTVRVRGVLDRTRLETLVEVAEGETRPVRLALGPKDAAPPPGATTPRPVALAPSAKEDRGGAGRVVGFVAMGIGGAAVITGGIFGVLALRDEASLRGRCPEDTCPSGLQPDLDAYESKKTISTVGLVGGAALGVGGAALYLFSTKRDAGSAGASTGLYWAGQRAGVWGTF